MKKQLLAAAVAGAIAAPAAMAAEGPSVNIYYPMAIQIGSTDSNNGTSTTDNETLVDGGGARLMFTWTDQLNNGMGLTAYMSFGNLAASNGNPDFSANTVSVRNAHLALTGDHGSIGFGTMENFFELDTIIDGYGADWGNGGAPLYFIQLGRTGFFFTRRDGESVFWNSKDMNGFSAKAAYTFGPAAVAGNAADPTGYQLGVQYASGALSIGANMAQYDDYPADGGVTDAAFSIDQANSAAGANAVLVAGSAPIAGSDASAQSWRASYDFGSFKVSGTMFSMKQTLGAQNQGVEATGYGINVTMPISTGRVIFNMSELDDQDVTQGGTTSALNDSGKAGFDISYQHDVSANTYMFIMYAAQDTGDNFDDNGAANANLRATNGDTDSESSAIMLGLTASF
ncbi:MAG: porin [Betaproteobacteria bacterium]